MTDTTPIRDAASVILVRDRHRAPRVLMGQRHQRAAFMPGVFVFPGGAVDPQDAGVPVHCDLSAACLERLADGAGAGLSLALQGAAIREVREETGLLLGRNEPWAAEPAAASWQIFADESCTPASAGFRFFFRAITPPGAPRRFDARFFLVDADQALAKGDLDDFSRADDELSNLQWVPLNQVASLRIAFITHLALERALPLIGHDEPPAEVPLVQGSRKSMLRRARADGDRFAY
jgi:8-oxo-dGTP pyrophosphatase MutT (NUDIX family)